MNEFAHGYEKDGRPKTGDCFRFPFSDFGLVFFYFISINVFAQPVANFSSNIVSGCTPLVVQFTDISSGNPNSWFWDFGNGNTSAVQNPGAFYTNPGVYTIKLIITDGSGSDTIIKPYYIKAFASPKTNFYSNDTLGCSPLIVNFSDMSVPQSAPVISWFWNFGDGIGSTLQNPTHIYSSIGNYTVYLTVKDANGCQDFLSINQYIKIDEPHANFNYQAIVCPLPATAYFTNTSTGAGLNFFWDFGDGDTSVTMNPAHPYAVSGTFYVKLIISDSIGCVDSIMYPVTAVNFQPDFTYSVICSDTNFIMNFIDNSIPASNGWQWDFGDGSIDSVQNPSHAFNNFQADTIRMIANIGQGCKDTVLKIYQPLVASFLADSLFCQSPFQVNFIDQSVGTGSLSYSWNFGDGSNGTDPNPNHIYTFQNSVVFDTLYIYLTVSDLFGCTDSIKDSIAFVVPDAKFSASTIGGCIPLIVQFSDTSISVDPIINWFWNFGNGDVSTLQNPPYTYIDTGTYAVTLIITTVTGCTDSITDTVRSGIKPDFIDFTYYDSLCFHNLYQWMDMSGFIDTSTHLNNWKWYFGYYPYNNYCVCPEPGDSTTEQNPFFDTGHWTIGYDTILFIAGYNGCNDSLMKTSFTVPPVNWINHNGDNTFGFCSGSTPITINLSNSSFGYTSNIDFFMTDMQTGQVTPLNPDSTVINTLTFNNAGKYKFNLTSFNDTSIITHADTSLGPGCFDSNPHFLLIIDSVHNGFSLSQEISCFEDSIKGDTVSFTDTSISFFGEIVQWFWTFGDGDSLKNDTIKYTYYYDTGDYILEGTDSVFPQSIGDTILFPFKNNNGNTLGTFQNPIHVYRDTGTYIVKQTLTVMVLTWCCGSQLYDTLWCNYTTSDTVIVDYLTAEFVADYTTICPGSTIIFYDSSEALTSLTHWEWFFGDGSSPDTVNQNPTHTYSDSGIYTVMLIAENYSGCMDTLIKNNYLNIVRPVADFIPSPSIICLGSVASFINNSSGYSINYFWDFGDGNTDTTLNPVHYFNAVGTYSITLTVAYPDGCDSAASENISVVSLPVGGFKPDTSWAACPPLPVLFSDTSSANITNWYWDFGDGQYSTLQNPAHLYNTSGNYAVTLIVTDTNGCMDTLIENNFIKIGGPYGTFTFTPDSGCVPYSINFFAGTVNSVFFFWDFGDGTLLNAGDSISHFYFYNGIFTPKLILQDSSGCTYIVPSVKQIFTNGLNADFSFGDSLFCNLDTVFFINQSTAFYPAIYQWNFGDGDTSIVVIPIHYYDSSGTYFITLKATDTTGCTSLITKKIIVNKAPEVLLIPADTAGCVPFRINFSAEEKDTLVKINSWIWNLGGGTIISGTPVSYIYVNPGIYNVKLTILYGDSACITDTVIKIDAYDVPVADFIFIPENSIIQNQPVQFTDQSVNADDWLWNFGNSNTSLKKNPEYIYRYPGEFTITLIVFNKTGCSDTVEKEIEIIPVIPNIITPNGDGVNDVFIIEGTKEQQISIFNRWGEKIYENTATEIQWYGKNFAGADVTGGTYFYVLNSNDENGGNIMQKGYIMVIK